MLIRTVYLFGKFVCCHHPLVILVGVSHFSMSDCCFEILGAEMTAAQQAQYR